MLHKFTIKAGQVNPALNSLSIFGDAYLIKPGSSVVPFSQSGGSFSESIICEIENLHTVHLYNMMVSCDTYAYIVISSIDLKIISHDLSHIYPLNGRRFTTAIYFSHHKIISQTGIELKDIARDILLTV